MNTKPDTVRSFVAIELPEQAKSFLTEISANLRRIDADVKWVKPESIHLTLKFLGEIHRDTIPSIERDLGPALLEFTPFRIQIIGLGAFPNLKRPRVIWAGLQDTSGTLAPLAARVEEALQPHGFKKEKRRFNPHLTLGRVRSARGQLDLVDAVRQGMDLLGPSFTVDGAVLFQSILKPSGAEYRALCRFECSLDEPRQ